MAMIEGIGDEVIILLTLLAILLMTALAWISTHVREPLLEIFIIDGSRLGNLIQRLQDRRRGSRREEATTEGEQVQNEGNITENTTTNPDNEENVNTDNSSNVEINSTGENSETANSGQDNAAYSDATTVHENNEVAETVSNTMTDTEAAPASHNELRQRRLNFFKVNPINEESSSTQSRNIQKQAKESNTHSETANIQGVSEEQISNEETASLSPDGQAANDEAASVSPDEQAANDEAASVLPDAQAANEDAASEPPDGHITVRLKYLDDRQKLVHVSPDDTVAQFKRRHFAAELAENFIVRFIFNGQELRQDATLQSYNVRDNSVIHCLLSNQNNHAPRRDDQDVPELDIGRWMFPLFGLILGVVWYYRIVYRNYFNTPTTLSLIGITFLYFTTLLATLRQDEDQARR